MKRTGQEIFCGEKSPKPSLFNFDSESLKVEDQKTKTHLTEASPSTIRFDDSDEEIRVKENQNRSCKVDI